MRPAKKPWIDLIVSLSIANLLFIRLWLKILPYDAGSSFFLAYSPLNCYLAAMLNVLAWGGLLFLLVRGARGSRAFPWLVLSVFFATCLIVAYGVGVAFISVAKFVFLFGPKSAIYLEIACWFAVCLGLFLLVKYREGFARHYALLPLLLSPYLLMTFGQSIAAVVKAEPAAHFLPHAVNPPRPLKNPLGIRVVWIIFDETDYRLAFEKRPSSLSLPAFDGFREGAFSATRAYSPNDNTQTSLPSLLTGLPLVKTVQQGADRLGLEHAGTRALSAFSSADTIFKEIKSRGGSTALLGWFLPYSRTLPFLDLCRDYSRYNYYTSQRLLDVFLHQPREIVDFRFLPFTNTLLGDNQIGMVREMTADVADAVKNHDPSLLFLHYSIPHSPNVYHRHSGRFGFNRSKREGYLDNLALADRSLGELRREMEAKGTWDDSLVIVSSDHHWRTNTYDGVTDRQHVPFMMKFPHERRPFVYRGRFNTVLTKELILNVVDKKIASPEEVARWLDTTMRQGTTPITFAAERPDAD